jgi:ribosomal protein S20
LSIFTSASDKAAKSKVIHSNAASRAKSRLSSKIAAIKA